MKSLFIHLYACLVFVFLVHGQDQSGFVSIDCGNFEGSEYEDGLTSISYTSDMRYVDTGTNHDISSNYMSGISSVQLSNLRSFPKGIKNCYTIKIAQARGNKFLIRATFMYGNYDSKNQLPEFSLYLNGDQWDIITFNDASDIVKMEIIHTSATDYIHVCLVDTGSGTPFISVLELRQLNNTIYKAHSGSLKLLTRLDIGSNTDQIVRYPDDAYDRIWVPDTNATDVVFVPDLERFSAYYPVDTLSDNVYEPASSVMSTAVRPLVGRSLNFTFTPYDTDKKYFYYMHFAEIETKGSRTFDIYLNDKLRDEDVTPDYLIPTTLFTPKFVSSVDGELKWSFVATNGSTLPPILNALEIYEVKFFSQFPTDQSDVDAIRNIKSAYIVEKNWQGDPCVPKEYLWNNLECSYDNNSFKIISLNLSSSSLSGIMNTSFSGLKSLQSLDLSNNSLTGSVPDFLRQLPFLKTLNLSGNNFTGSVPLALIEKSKNGFLALSIEGNPLLCQEDSCARPRRKKNYVIPIVASIASCLVLLAVILATWWGLKRKKHREDIVESNAKDEMLEEKNRQFTYAEVKTITNNFKTVIGKGAIGSVYAGQLPEGTQVAVKMLSLPSTQGSKQFRTEAQLLTKVHHRNLVSIIGYCNEGLHIGLIYEYMANGTIKEHLSEKNAYILSWEQRLQIAFDVAQALEYLHDGCKPKIIHRDIKTDNILLTENMQAKISDFGISRLIPLDGTHVSTGLAGTPGYMDPEYQVTNELNEKSDVFSFGIVLLELITGKPPIIRSHENIHVVKWVRPMVERAEIKEIVDSRLNGGFDTNSAWKVVETAMACVELNSIRRPLMRQVVVDLRVCLEMVIARTNPSRENLEQFNSASRNSVVNLGSSIGGPVAR